MAFASLSARSNVFIYHVKSLQFPGSSEKASQQLSVLEDLVKLWTVHLRY